MKVFISWSSALSHNVALLLKEWLPSVIQVLKVYVSSEDIAKGANWSDDISRELAQSEFGILCLTPENINEPWILFEAGALSVSVNKRVTPLLINLTASNLQGPLALFQATRVKKDDMYKLLKTINSLLKGNRLDSKLLETSFLQNWYKFKFDFQKILAAEYKPEEDIMRDLLEAINTSQSAVEEAKNRIVNMRIDLVTQSAADFVTKHPPTGKWKIMINGVSFKEVIRSTGYKKIDGRWVKPK